VKILRILVLLFFLAGITCQTWADDGFWPGGTYDSKVPTPESVLGYKIGQKHTPHHLIEKYIDAVAAASDRVKVLKYGKTHQGRGLYHVVISTPENLERIPEIKKNIKILALRDKTPNQAEVDALVKDTPVITMLNYNVHGGEASACEAALRTIYQMAAGTDEKTLKILDQVLTIIDPVQNPDGHDRYANFINGYLVDYEDAQTGTYEHSEPWPGGRSNAYFFDLNRDWFLMTQAESQQRVKAIVDWMPQVAPDFHEMGTNSTYYFPPPMKPHNHLFTEVTSKWWEIFGQANAKAFDEFGWNYYTRESFDYFYPGYGGSLPTYLGGIAMTYEQASARSRNALRNDGTILTLKEATHHHFITSMATLLTSAERKEEKLRDFNKYFVELINEAKNGGIREVYIPPADPVRFNKLIHKLQVLGGKVEVAKAEFKVAKAHNYFLAKEEAVTLPKGTAIVSLAQWSGKALRTVLEPQSPLDPEFLKEERERFDKNMRSRFYDLTAWSLPLTYGIPAYCAKTAATVEKEAIAEIIDFKPVTKEVGKAKVAYLIPPDTNANISLVGKLMQAGHKLTVATLKFKLNDRNYPPGTVVVRVHRNNDKLLPDLNRFIKETGGYADVADTGYTPEGIDLGSNNVRNLKNIKIALVGDDPFSSSNFGALRYLFEQVHGFKYSAIRASRFSRFPLEKYNVLILPGSWGGGFAEVIGKRGIEKLKNWVSNGGVVIAISSSIDFLSHKDVGLTPAQKYSQKRKEIGDVPEIEKQAENKDEKGDSKDKPNSGKEKKWEVEKLFSVPGAILRVKLDDRSYLNWGYSRDFAPVLVNGRNCYVPLSDDQGLTSARYAAEKELLISGHIWPESSSLLPGNAYAWHKIYGNGVVVCFAEDPVFRASYDGLERMLFNAILFSSYMSR
jgi:hypothetical protein